MFHYCSKLPVAAWIPHFQSALETGGAENPVLYIIIRIFVSEKYWWEKKLFAGDNRIPAVRKAAETLTIISLRIYHFNNVS